MREYIYITLVLVVFISYFQILKRLKNLKSISLTKKNLEDMMKNLEQIMSEYVVIHSDIETKIENFKQDISDINDEYSIVKEDMKFMLYKSNQIMDDLEKMICEKSRVIKKATQSSQNTRFMKDSKVFEELLNTIE